MRLLSAMVLMSAMFVLTAVAAPIETVTVRGWLSDEQCARARASAGTYTGTSPRCAQECVAKGKKIVLIDPDKKAILNISNQSAAEAHLSDLVEITGTMENGALRIDTLKMVEKGVAACERPKLQQ